MAKGNEESAPEGMTSYLSRVWGGERQGDAVHTPMKNSLAFQDYSERIKGEYTHAVILKVL